MARRRISQATLAEHLGMHQVSVSKRLNGRVPFDINEIHSIAHLLNVPVTVLLPDPESQKQTA